MGLRSEVIQRWWPTTQSLDLVEGDVETAAAAVRTEVARFLGKEPLVESWQSLKNLDVAFSSASEFANVPTLYLVLPTSSRWSVLWNNSFLCDGYDSLCWCITGNHHLATLHWAAHDETTTFQSGASFTYRSWNDAIVERSVYAGREDDQWTFHQVGTPLPEEDLATYQKRRVRDRLNESLMKDLLARFGAAPWSEQFYDLNRSSFVIRRTSPPSTVTRRRPAEVVKGSG